MDIAISLDDFGTGYSSFSRLAELHIDTIKIDRFFIDKISHTARKDPDHFRCHLYNIKLV